MSTVNDINIVNQHFYHGFHEIFINFYEIRMYIYLLNYQFEGEWTGTLFLFLSFLFSSPVKTINYELIFQNSPLVQQKATKGDESGTDTLQIWPNLR